MKGSIKKRTAFLLAILMTFSSLQPAFPISVFAEPATVSAPEAEAAGESNDGAEAQAEISADSPAFRQVSDDTAVIEEGNAGNGVSGNDISANDISVNDISGYGTDYEGEQTGMSTIVIDGFEYGTGALDDEGFEIIAHPDEFDGEEAAGGIADQKKYNADLAYDKMEYVSPVRNQGSTGLCWMFGATSAIESNIRKTYGLNAQDELEISPKYGAWWLFHKAKGSLGGYVDNDWIELRNEPKTDAERTYNAAPTPFARENAYTRRGGYTWCSLAAFTEWLGPVNVDDSNRITYHRKSSLEMLASEPHLTDENPYRQDYQVQNINIYAYPLKGKTRKDLEGMVKNGSAMNAIKDMKGWIASHGALAGSMNTNFLSRDNAFCYDPGDPWPYEKDQNRYTHTTHIISFVGWDDTIPKEWFSEPASKAAKQKYFSEEEFTPPGDGAWICKNSWGSDIGKNGFFYMSYYDGSLRYPFNSFAGYDAVDINRNKTDHKRTVYDNNYQYNSMTTLPVLNDGSGRYDHRSYYASAPKKIQEGYHFGAVYTAQSNEKLSAVGIATREEKLTFDVNIYTSSSNDLPLDEIENLGEIGWNKVSSTSDYPVRYAGFHTIELNTPVEVKKGTNFLVIFTMKRKGGGDIIIQEGTDDSGKSAKIGRNINVRGKEYYLENEYYYKKASGFSFDDLNSDVAGDLGYESDYDYDIKAFTINDAKSKTEVESYLEFYSGYEHMDLEVGDTVDMRQGLYFEAVSQNGIWDDVKEWTVSGDASVLRHDGNGVFTAVSASDNEIPVNVITNFGSQKTAYIRVVEKKKDYGITVSLAKTSYDYTGSLISVSQDVTVMSGNTVIYKEGKLTVSGFDVSVSENGAKDAGEAVATIVVSLSGDSVSDNTASENSLLKIADISFTIKPVNISISDKVRDESRIEDQEITEDGAEHKLVPKLFLYNDEGQHYQLISRNSTDKTSDAYYEYDYDIEYQSADYSKPGLKSIKLTGYGNFTGERYLNYRINEKGAEEDPTLSKNGLYVSRITPQTVPYTGNKHASSGTTKKKSGFNYDLGIEVKYDGRDLVEGRDYKISYYNNVAANIGVADAKEPYVIVKGQGKYKGLSAKRYFAIAPAELCEENTRVSGLKAVYPVDVSKTDTAVIKPVFTFAAADDTGKVVKKKLKKAATNKNTGKVTGDYELKFYRFVYYGEDDFPSGDVEETPYGEWKEIAGDNYTYSKSGYEDIVLVVAKGINNFSGMSTEIIKDTVEPDPRPGGTGITVVTDSLTCPGKGQLKGSSIKKIDIPAGYKKLTPDKKSFTVDELMQDTVMKYSYKDAQGKNKTLDITVSGEDFYHYLSVYNSENVEISEINQPGNYTVRVTGFGTFEPGQLKSQTVSQDLVAAKDVKLKVSGTAKIKASDFKLQYNRDYTRDDKWEDAGAGFNLDYDGKATGFRVVKKDGSVLPEEDYYVEGFLYDNAFPGKYTFTLRGRGMYGGSKATFSFTRNRLDINKALDTANGGKLAVTPSEKYASVFGAMPELTVKNGYEEDAVSETVDTSICSRVNGLSFSGKNNISSGEGGKLNIKAESDSPFKGTAKIPIKIARYDLSKLQGKNFALTDVSEDAVINSNKVFICAEDVYSESTVPNVLVYQYDATGTQRKKLAIDKRSLSAPVSKGSNTYVVTLKNEADKKGIVDFGSSGTEIPVRVLKAEQKAKKLEIAAGDLIDVSKQGAKFTGRPIRPSVTKVRAVMKDGSVKELNEGEFFVDYESNVSAGKAKVIVYALGKSDDAVGGKQVFTFKIR